MYVNGIQLFNESKNYIELTDRDVRHHHHLYRTVLGSFRDLRALSEDLWSVEVEEDTILAGCTIMPPGERTGCCEGDCSGFMLRPSAMVLGMVEGTGDDSPGGM